MLVTLNHISNIQNERRKRNYDEAFSILQKAQAENKIWNVDYQFIKETFSKSLEEAAEPYRKQFFGLGHQKLDSEVIWVTASYIHGAAKSVRDLKKIQVSLERQEALQELIKIYEDAITLNNAVKDLKSVVVKGRKPSDDPNKTPPRTIENTGTCAVCGMNVKLDVEGNIVHHGFQVKWNQRMGKCFGVGYKPFELSPEGAVQYKKFLSSELVIASRRLERPEYQGATTDKEILSTKRTLEFMVRQLSSDITYYRKKIVGWKLAELPEELLKKEL